MKHCQKRWMTYILSICMIFTMLLGNITTWAQTNDAIILHFKSDWGASKIYYWQTSPDIGNVTWPGVDMQAEEDDWYTYTLNTEYTNLIFNNGSGKQTEDLSLSTGEWWYKNGSFTAFNPEGETDSEIVLHFKTDKGSASLYYWNTMPETASVDWPGVAMESEGNDWYTTSSSGLHYSTLL